MIEYQGARVNVTRAELVGMGFRSEVMSEESEVVGVTSDNRVVRDGEQTPQKVDEVPVVEHKPEGQVKLDQSWYTEGQYD